MSVVSFIKSSIEHGAEYKRYTQKYKNAESLIDAGEYEEARKLLYGIYNYDYKDTHALIVLCSAHLSYEKGDLKGAYNSLGNVGFLAQSQERMDAILNFYYQMKKEYESDDYQKNLREQEEEKQRKYEERIINGVPFEGMPESRIADTRLGAPSGNVRHEYKNILGVKVDFNVYDFIEDGQTIFTAKCAHGKVWEVENFPKKPTSPPQSSNTSTHAFSENFPVNDFSDPEDFYDWYYDYFDDFEEAEDYYYSHGGK